MSFQMIGMMAEWERDNIVERTKNGRLQRYKDGCWAGGKAPYGYSYDKATRKLVVNESEARIVRRMYTEYAAGKSLFRISQELNRDGIHARSKKGRGWWQVAVRQVLLNPVYKGTEVVNRHAHISLIHKMDLSNAIMMPVTPLVSEQVWQIAQDRMRTNKPGGPNRQGAHLLQGLITCGVCGYGFASKRHYYTCRGRMKYVHPDGKARCEAPYLRADWLENEVWRRIDEILNDPNKLLLVIAENIDNLKATEAELSARISPINDQLADIAEKQAMLADDWITRHMNKDRFNELRENLNRDEARLKGLRANMDPAQIRELEDARTTLNFWEQQAKSMARNTENEDGTMFRLVDRPHRVALKLVGFDDADLNKSAGFPTSRR